MTLRPPPDERGDTASGRPAEERGAARLRAWTDHIDELIAEARERGEFDNLQGAGQPLRLEKNVYAGEKELAYSILHNNHMSPPEIERGKEIDGELARAEKLLMTLRRHREALHARHRWTLASERHAYNLLRDKTATRYADALREINSKTLSLNIIAPAALHRRTIDVEERLRAFDAEFPRLEV